MKRQPLMAGNWKMHLNHLEAISLVQKVAFSLNEKKSTDVEVVFLPPFTHIRSVQTLVAGERLTVGYGAQDVSRHDSGAYTGDISGAMLSKLGCSYVVVGHSERREHHHEDDPVVNAKVKAALKHGLVPILCVGEPLDVRQAGDQVPHVVAQVASALSQVKAEQILPEGVEVARLVVAYEPVWAIGTGEVATPENAQEVCAAIREKLAEKYNEDLAASVRVLYGGSVKATNIAPIMAQKDIDGALVGGASIVADEFVSICRYKDHSGGAP